jgi:putative tryptophan/tyrosine transport system substrate-binding protein
MRHGATARRKIFCFALCALLLASGLSVEAQQPGKAPRIGYVVQRNTPSLTTPDLAAEAFRKGLYDLGYIEGKNMRLEYRYAVGMEDLPGLVAELVQLIPPG